MTSAPYRTRDLGLAAFLKVRGHDHDDEVDDGGSVWFLFPGLDRSVKEDYFGGGTVPARAYSVALRELKARVFWLKKS